MRNAQANGVMPLSTARRGKWRAVLAIGVTALLLAAPFAVYPITLMEIMCFALFASAVNLLLGYVGLLSFGHAIFFGGGAYICAYVMKSLGVTPELGLVAGTLFGAVFGFVCGLLAIRRTGIYFAMVTLGLGQMFYFICVQAPFTQGEDGIQGVPRGKLFSLVDLNGNTPLFYVVMAVVTLGILFVYRVVHSPFGQILTAIRDNEPRAVSLGYEAPRYKVLAFTLSAAVAGLAGALKVLVFQLASLTDVTGAMSGQIILMILVGGMGTTLGPLLGAAIVIAMQEYLAGLDEWVVVVQGFIFVICVTLFRRGLVGELAAVVRGRSL